MRPIKAYKIFRVKNKTVYFVKHGGAVEFDIWLKAVKKPVYDGSDKRYYHSGFHIFKTYDQAQKYLSLFRKHRRDKIILPVYAIRVSKKLTNPDVFLADKIKVPFVSKLQKKKEYVTKKIRNKNV